jgi:hypothetical protein
MHGLRLLASQLNGCWVLSLLFLLFRLVAQMQSHMQQFDS